jgi:hypothetical protein
VRVGSRCGAHVETYHDQDYRKLYRTREWARIRRAQLDENPWCAECLKVGAHTLASDVDHVQAHRGQAFFDGPFQSLCHSHHSKKTMSEVMG